MQITTKLYPSANCNAGQLARMAEEIPGQDKLINESSPCGYFLVNDTLVPYAFLDLIEADIGYGLITIEYGDVFTPEDLMDDQFWAILTEQERAVLGPCVLLLIEQGRIALTFPEVEPDDLMEMERPEGMFLSVDGKYPKSLIKKIQQRLYEKPLVPNSGNYSPDEALGLALWNSLSRKERAALKGSEFIVMAEGHAHLHVKE